MPNSDQLNQCPNCASPVTAQYCSNCGQNQHYRVDRFLLSLINEALEGIFTFSSRFWRTVFSLLFRPGFLSIEYLKGRRATYVQPIRLYLVTSILFFVVLTTIDFFENIGNELVVDPGTTSSQQTESSESNLDENEPLLDPAEGTEKTEDDQTDSDATLDELSTKVDKLDLSLPFLSKETEARLKEFIVKQSDKAIGTIKDDPHALTGVFLDLAPPIIFCLLPLFAVLLKLGYLGKGIYYAEHLILAVHNHCFIFLILTWYLFIEVPLRKLPDISSWLGILVTAWITVYMWKSIKNVYRQGRTITTFKFIFFGLCYIALLTWGIIVTLLIGFLTL